MLSIILDMLFLLALIAICFCFDISTSPLFFYILRFFALVLCFLPQSLLFLFERVLFVNDFLRGIGNFVLFRSPSLLYLNAICIDIEPIFIYLLYCIACSKTCYCDTLSFNFYSISYFILKIIKK